MKVVVVGAGIMGLSTAWALKRRGHEVDVLEQGPFPNPLASSVDDHRVLRRAYGPELGYQAMVTEAYQSWSRLWADLGRSLYVETGVLYVSRSGDPWLAASVEGLAAAEIAVERIEPDEAVRRFPVILPEGIGQAVHVPSSGPLRAGEIVAALGRWLAAKGTAIRTRTRVVAVEPAHAAVILADGTRVAGDRLVLAAGPWSPGLVPALAAGVTPSRQLVTYLEPPPDLAAAWQAMPVLADLSPDASFYAVPPASGMRLKIAGHTFSLAGDPDRERVATAADTETVLAIARGRVRDLRRFRVLETKTCFYDVTADERFLAATVDRTVVLTGFSGHGFKFGAIVGEKVAAAVIGEMLPAALAAWAAGRVAAKVPRRPLP
ncbi:MAG: FAD-dependent oxidoreductase [Alphaproteobacteria bacterium]|nr:FAD-dependent oxidoreductase [Alphaproteobacteria bacterium]